MPINKHAEMTAKLLGQVAEIFFESEFISEFKLERFKLDFYNADLKIAIEYDGPEHYCDVWHIERDLRKDALCKLRGIQIIRWPYYFQLTKDVAKYLFDQYYSEKKYLAAIDLVYGCQEEFEILAPGLHRSKHTPANYVERGVNRFVTEMMAAPPSLCSQVLHSFLIYRERIGSDLSWLIFPSNFPNFDALLKRKPNPLCLNYYYPFQAVLQKST